jgi:nucleoside-diphosphate-sugar epimerase
VVLARLFNVSDRDSAPTWRSHAGSRDFTYVADAVAGVLGALERGGAAEIHNIAGRGSAVSDGAGRVSIELRAP